MKYSDFNLLIKKITIRYKSTAHQSNPITRLAKDEVQELRKIVLYGQVWQSRQILFIDHKD